MCRVVDVAIQLKHFKNYGSIEWNAKHTSKQKNLKIKQQPENFTSLVLP